MDYTHSMLVNVDFTLRLIKNYKEICLTEDGDPKPETQSIAFACTLVGIPDIAEGNIDEWMVRLKILRECGYSVGVHTDEDWWPCEDLVRKHVGLMTSAEELTDEQFYIWLGEELRHYVSSIQISHMTH